MYSNIKYWTSERFFNRLDFFLDKNGLTFNQLSQLAETSISSIYQIRRRKALPNFRSLCAICDALVIQLWEFFDADDERTAETEIVVSEMKHISKENQVLLSKVVKQMR